jgi:type IV pilus assembly protein PilB
MVKFQEEKQERKLKELRQQEEETLAQLLADRYGFEYIDLSRLPINTDALRLVPEEKAREAKLAVFNMIGKRLQVAVLSPKNTKAQQLVQELKIKGFLPTVYMVSTQSLERAWRRYKEISYATETQAGLLSIGHESIANLLQQVRSLEDVKTLIKGVVLTKKNYRTSKLLEMILAGALALKASDIHLEPEVGYVRLRYRLDGMLTDIIDFDLKLYPFLLSRIKILSGVKLNIKQRAQDGRFTIKIHEDEIEIRTSVLPGAYNDSIVMRILNPKAIAVSMDELGIEPQLLKIVEREIRRPNGLILTTGPTGSGKTTTLYAFLKKIHKPEIKIITIEDPIEYHLPGIVQTQTRKNYTFAQGLRSALRQDPDVMMVGEIRDEETAEIAVNAALTGHIVFSTLHTNNAAGTFPRLIDLGVDPKVISSAMSIALAQRLVRKLCEYCKKEVVVGEKEKAIMDNILKTVARKELIPQKTNTMWQASKCEKCSFLGYRGRIGIFEAILVDRAIDMIVRENPNEREIWEAAKPQGILTMQQDGIIKVLHGVTTLEELSRVVDLESNPY